MARERESLQQHRPSTVDRCPTHAGPNDNFTDWSHSCSLSNGTDPLPGLRIHGIIQGLRTRPVFMSMTERWDTTLKAETTPYTLPPLSRQSVFWTLSYKRIAGLHTVNPVVAFPLDYAMGWYG